MRCAGEAAADGNEAFRVDACAGAPPGGLPAAEATAAAQRYDQQQYEQYQQWQAYYQQHQGHEYNVHQQQAAAAAAAAATDPAEAMLQVCPARPAQACKGAGSCRMQVLGADTQAALGRQSVLRCPLLKLGSCVEAGWPAWEGHAART